MIHKFLSVRNFFFGFFNDFVFTKERAEYAAEGVDLALVSFENNGPTLELLEAPRHGVFAMIDEEVRVPRGSDGSLLTKIEKRHKEHDRFAAAGVHDAENTFGVRHYAATVSYNVNGFLEKNRDLLSADLAKCMKETSGRASAGTAGRPVRV